MKFGDHLKEGLAYRARPARQARHRTARRRALTGIDQGASSAACFSKAGALRQPNFQPETMAPSRRATRRRIAGAIGPTKKSIGPQNI
jgi:hypothetical protein